MTHAPEVTETAWVAPTAAPAAGREIPLVPADVVPPSDVDRSDAAAGPADSGSHVALRRFPGEGVQCAGQLVRLPAGRYDWLYLLVGETPQLRATVWLHYRGGLDPEELVVTADQGGVARVPVTRRDSLVAIRLPDLPGVRIGGATLVTAALVPAEPTAATGRAADPGGALAMFGGSRAVPEGLATRALIGWPVVTDAEHTAVRDVLDRAVFTSNDGGRGEVSALERDWAAYVGVPHCAAVANGTAAIELALAALDLEPGSEVLVPALTFVATAVAPVARLLVPVFVDIDPVTFTIAPEFVEAAITPRTRAVIAVHLHGLPCDLTALRAIAARHGLYLVEDAAQAQAATYEGRRVAGFGEINTVSLNVTKNLPTCGEGGLITTADPALHERVVLARQFGEVLRGGQSRDYLSRVLAGNEKMSAVQAAFARCQLDRLDEYAAARDRNVRRFLDRLAGLPGVTVPACPPDRTHAWHILRMRFSPAALGHDDVAPAAFRDALRRALRAEGVPVQPYQSLPLPAQPAFQQLVGFGGYPWRLPGVPPPDYRPERFPHTQAVIDDSLTLQRWHLNPAAEPVLARCADAFEKVWEHMDAVMAVASAWTRSRQGERVRR